MGLLTDILKEIPQAAVLKEKIATIEAKYAAADTENAILKDDLREADAKIKQLEKQLEKLSHKDDLSEFEVQLLTLISRPDQDSGAEFLARELNVNQARVEHFLHKLIESKHIRCEIRIGWPNQYHLLPKGSATLIERNLI